MRGTSRKPPTTTNQLLTCLGQESPLSPIIRQCFEIHQPIPLSSTAMVPELRRPSKGMIVITPQLKKVVLVHTHRWLLRGTEDAVETSDLRGWRRGPHPKAPSQPDAAAVPQWRHTNPLP